MVRQVFIARPDGLVDDLAFERKLYVVRKLAERGIRAAGIKGGDKILYLQPVVQDDRCTRAC